MTEQKFTKLCKETIVKYFNENSDKADKVDNAKITEEQVFIVWEAKVLKNNKAVLSTIVPDGMYYEITYNGDKNEIYLDAYKKWENVCIEVEE